MICSLAQINQKLEILIHSCIATLGLNAGPTAWMFYVHLHEIVLGLQIQLEQDLEYFFE